MQPSHLFSVLLALPIAAAGCSGDDELPALLPDAPSPDAAIDATPSPLIGTWRTFDPTITDAQKSTLTLGADGTLEIVRPDRTLTGDWNIEPDGRLHTTMGTLPETGSFYVSATRLMTLTQVPSGPVSGVVGTWIGHINGGTDDLIATLVLEANSTMALTLTGDSPAHEIGTYTLDGPRLTLTTQASATIHLVAIPDVAIGQALYERVAP
jgi:hypothetical protein